MLIRSQDKMKIAVIENCGQIEIRRFKDNLEAIACGFESDDERYIFVNGARFATYSTEQIAISVLDEICNMYQYVKECEATGVGASQPEFVYYMPENNENGKEI